MSSKRAMRQAQKQAYAKHRSNITNNRFKLKKKILSKNKKEKKKIIKNYFLSFLSAKNKAIINITVHANIDIVFKGVVFAPQTSKNKAPIIIPMA